MRPMRELLRILPVAALPLLVPSCAESLDLDRFTRSGAAINQVPTSVTLFDLRFSCRSMQSHVNEYLELRVVDKAFRVQAKAVYVDIQQPDFSIYLSKIIPKANPPYHIDFWADHNNTNKYDGIEGGIDEKDHAWRRTIDPTWTSDPSLLSQLPEDIKFEGTTFDFNFLHDTNFVDIFTDAEGRPIATDADGNAVDPSKDLLPFDLKLINTEPVLGKMVEVRVVEKESGRLVGLHRQGIVRQDYTPQILSILDSGTVYEISIFADIDGNGKFSEGDPSWKTEITSTRDGITNPFDLGTPNSPIETGEPAPTP